MASSSRGAIYSEGGAVFIGDRSAGRDIITINHISAVRPLAQSLHYSFFTSWDQFKSVQNDLGALMSILQVIESDQGELDPHGNGQPELIEHITNCYDILKELEGLKNHYDSVGTQTRRTWERELWRREDLNDIRARLTTTITSLNLVYSTLIQSSTKTVLRKVEMYLEEIRTGKREGSVVASHTADSLSAGEREAWRILRKDLESVGITPTTFAQHRDLIIKRLLKAVENEELVDNFEGGFENDLDEESPETSQRALSAKATKNEVLQLPNVSSSPAVKGPTRLARLVYKVTNSPMDILQAAEAGNMPLVKALLGKGANVASKDINGLTPLHWAAMTGHEAVVKLLLGAKADVDAQDNRGLTPLLLVARRGNEAVVKLLLEAKADVEVRNSYGLTPLALAAQTGHHTVVKLLLEAKANVETRDDNSSTPLMLAAKLGHEAVVKLLLEAKAYVEDRDFHGLTPLALAALNRRHPVVKLLLEAKANVEARDDNSSTPLMLAAKWGHEGVVKLLLEAKADIKARDKDYSTPVSLAVYYGQHAVARLLLSHSGHISPPCAPAHAI